MLFVSVLVACHHPTAETQDVTFSQYQELTAIDSLMWTQPDSALILLLDKPIDDPYYQLLLYEALYKNYYAQANRPELLESMRHYDSVGNVFLAARCHYMNGVGYFEMDSVVEACNEYLKAIETMEKHYDEKALNGHKAQFMALIYVHLCELFSDQYLHEQAIYFGKRSLGYFSQYAAEPWHVAWILTKVGSHFQMLRNLNSAAYYYERAEEVLDDTTSLMYRDIASSLALLQFEGEDNPRPPLSRLYRLATQAESDKELLARYSIIGEVYYQEKQYDSAVLYLRNVFENTQNMELKMLVAKHLSEISQLCGDEEQTVFYARYLSSYANVGELQGALHSELICIFQKHEQERYNRNYLQRTKTIAKQKLIWIGALVFFVVVLLVLFIVTHRKSRRLMTQNTEHRNQLEKERYAHRIQQAALTGRLKKSNELLRNKSRQLKEMSAIQNETELHDDLVAFMESPICTHILEMVKAKVFKPKMDYLIYKDCALDKKQLCAFIMAAETHLVHFSSLIRNRFPSLNEEDVKYCYLYLLGLNEAEISALMQRAYSTVCERNRKIKRIINTEKELTTALYGMLNQC